MQILTRLLLCGTLAAAAAALPQAASAPARPLEIYFVDVEGGAATLTVTPAGESVLVDCGWPREDGRDAKRIRDAAQAAGISQIDHFVATHWHTDHYGGIEQLAKLMPVKRYWDRGIPEQATDGARDFPVLIEAYRRASGGSSTALKPGDVLPLIRSGAAGAPVELKVLASAGKVIGEKDGELPGSCARHPAAPVKDESDNMLSVGLLLSHQRFRFLNLGDLTWNLEHKLACPKNRVGRVDLWQVTHHGAPQSGNPALVEAIQPRCAVICNGPRKGGAPQTLATLRKSRSLQAVYQLHRNVAVGPEENTEPQRIANMDEECRAEFIRVRLSPKGDRYTVSIGASGPTVTFPVR
jgi:competence protein ComEC